MVLLDLFAGIGGFSYAAHQMGWHTAAFVEKDAFCQAVLKKNFPNVPIFGDIKEFDGTAYTGSIDLVCGGFPCQPFSHAGKRKGTDDDRFLWYEMLRAIREARPAWVVGENVAGLLSMGGGSVLDDILTDLENEGYTPETFTIPACAVQAPHERDRVWIIAHASERGRRQTYPNKYLRSGQSNTNGGYSSATSHADNRYRPQTEIRPGWHEFADCYCDASNANFKGLQKRESKRGDNGEKQPPAFRNNWQTHWYEVATQLCRVDDGLSARLDKNRAKRLKALGNAIVPAVALEIFKAIEKVNNICAHQ